MASSSSSVPQNKYDVFLSFRGEDTRDNFTSHLYSALCRKQVQTFIDNQLTRGDEISPSLLKAIEGSAISIVIFSEGYASSGWCLDELVKILECKNKYGQILIPVFYRVDPSDVRNQTGIFGDLFSKLEERFQVRLDQMPRWRTALKEATNLTGFDSQVIRPECELIEKIANDILKRLNNKFESSDKEHLIGVESSIREIESLLRIGLTNVYALGIWGIGGIGKTTIARAVFNKISCNFEGSCFIENIRSEEDKRGLDHLRQQLLSKLLDEENVKIGIHNNGLNFRRLNRKKVLIVFDDVTRFDQIEYLIGSLLYFGEGSRIIITTRDKQVLKNCRVNGIYKVKELSCCDALKLFSQHAFRVNRPNAGGKELSKKIIEYAHGVPLALKVLGCFLFERKKEDWESAIKKLKRIPHKDIQKVLKISYDSLDDEEQNIFLDIACFFKGEEKDYTMNFLDACGFSAKIGIRVLVDKCLIIISDNKITMHDLLQEMGWEIIRQESTNDPGKRSRLWHHKDIYEVLTYNTGTEKIQGISFDMSKVEEMQLNPRTFTKMRKLRLLKFYGENKCKLSHFRGPGFTEIRYLHWQGFPMKSLPSGIHPEYLVSLELWDSKVEKLWDGVQNLVKLKVIDISFSEQLTKLPDLSMAQNLEKLSLEGCSSLVETHSSIQHLNKLVSINLCNCESLKSLPPSIHSESLEELLLSGCSSLKRLPEFSSCNIKELHLDRIAFEELPSSIVCLSRLVTLDLENCSRLKQLPGNICKLKSLQSLYIFDCSNLHRLPHQLGNLECLRTLHVDGTSIRELPSSIVYLHHLTLLKLNDCGITELPESLGQLSSLCELHLEKNNFERIPESIVNLSCLMELYLSYCGRLRYLPKLPSGLCCMQADHCTSLEALSGLSVLFTLQNSLQYYQCFDLRNCCKLDGNELSEIVGDALERIQLTTTTWCKTSPDHHDYGGYICYPGSEIPEWFKFQRMGSSINLELPQDWSTNNKFVGFAFCAIVAFGDSHYCDQDFELWYEWNVKTKDGQCYVVSGGRWFVGETGYVDSDHVFWGYKLGDCRFSHGFDKYHYGNENCIQFYTVREDKYMVKECGFHLLYGQDFGESMKDRCRSFSIDEEDESHPKRLKY